jgi:hypothetical protein
MGTEIKPSEVEDALGGLEALSVSWRGKKDLTDYAKRMMLRGWKYDHLRAIVNMLVTRSGVTVEQIRRELNDE